MANYVINAGTYTDFNFRTLSNIVLIGQIVVQGNFEIRSAGYIDCSQATILATDTSGSIVLQASGVHPDYPGYALTMNNPSTYYPHAFGAAILLGPIIASGYTLSLLSGLEDPDEPDVIKGTSAYGPNGTQVQITAFLIKTNSIGVWVSSSGTNDGVPKFTSQQVNYSSLVAYDYRRQMTTGGSVYTASISGGYFGRTNFIEAVSPNRVYDLEPSFIDKARQVPWNGDPTSIPYSAFNTVGIKLSDVAEYFGDTGSNRLQEFYRGGGLVPGVTPADGVSVPRNINAGVPESGEIRLSDFFGAKRWTNSYTDPNIASFVVWYPNGPTDEGPVPGPLLVLYLNDVFATSTYFFGQFGMSIPATIAYSGITYNINPVAYEEDMRESGLYSSSHVATAA